MIILGLENTGPFGSYCRLELRLALAGGDGSHLILALGEGYESVLQGLPTAVTDKSWPPADAAQRLAALVRGQLQNRPPAIRTRLSEDQAKRLSTAFLEEAKLPQPQPLRGIVCSLPPGVEGQSIGARFVGRADLLRGFIRFFRGAAASRPG